MLDQRAIFLIGAREETGHVHEGHDRNPERIAEPHETRRLARGVDIEHAGKHHWLVGDKSHRAPGEPAEPGDYVLGESLFKLEEVAFVYDLEDQLLDVVGPVGTARHERVERPLFPRDVVIARPLREIRCIAGGKKVQQAAHLQQALEVIVVGAVGDARFGGVHRRAAKLLGSDDLIRHRLDHVRTGHEHVARVAHHEDEIGHGGRIDVAPGTRAHDHRDLRDDAGGEHVALEHFAITAERRDSFLNARAAGIEQPDDRRTRLHGEVLDLGDLLRVRFGQRAAEHGEILGEGEDRASVHGAPARDHAIAGNLALLHAELGRAVLDEHVELLEGAFIGEESEAFPRRELAALVLGCDARLAASGPRAGAAAFELFQDVFHARCAPHASAGKSIARMDI